MKISQEAVKKSITFSIFELKTIGQMVDLSVMSEILQTLPLDMTVTI